MTSTLTWVSYSVAENGLHQTLIEVQPVMQPISREVSGKNGPARCSSEPGSGLEISPSYISRPDHGSSLQPTEIIRVEFADFDFLLDRINRINENHVNLIHPVREVLPKEAKFSRVLCFVIVPGKPKKGLHVFL